MRLNILQFSVAACTLSTLTAIAAAASWSYNDATVSIQGKGTGVGGGLKEKLSSTKPLAETIKLSTAETLKIILTTLEGSTAKRAHQTFLSIEDSETGLETSYAFSVKESGKAKLELTTKDIPTQLLASPKPLSASIIIGSFGSPKPHNSKAFDLIIKSDQNAPIPSPEKPLRYGKLPEIHHIFRPDPTSPPVQISMVFTLFVIAALPNLLIVWAALGANLSHLSKALSSAPVSHTLFFGSILAMEGIFFMYYTSWNLFQTLPAAAVAGFISFLSGSRALSEVQERRLAGLR